jgi:hypothetical protein
MSKINEDKKMVIKVAGVDYPYSGGHEALTLDIDELGLNESGWVIEGEVHEDYYEWVNEFEANHCIYGKITGDFETQVVAENEEAFQHFWENHEPDGWDYWDI